jgi:adenylate kinase family enzyme
VDRVVVIGNSGGGKSVLARHLAQNGSIPCVELDRLLWRPGWALAPEEEYRANHARAIAAPRWVLDGLGTRDSIEARFARATHVVLVDLPVWLHFALAAERQIAWAAGNLEHPPAQMQERPPTEALFRNMWEMEREWLPFIRQLTESQVAIGKPTAHLTSLEALDAFSRAPAFSVTALKRLE